MWWQRVVKWAIPLSLWVLIGVLFRARASVPVVILAGMIAGAVALLIREVARLASGASSPPPDLRPVDLAPADGLVERFALAGFGTEPNAIEPEWRCVGAREPGFRAPASPLRAPRVRLERGLFGRVAVLSLFVGRFGRGWSDAEIAQACAATVRAARWIEEQAIRWQAPVNLRVATTYFAADDDEPEEPIELALVAEGEETVPVETHPVSRWVRLASRAASRLGFHDFLEMVEQVRPRAPDNVQVWLVHVRSAGRSLAITPADLGVPGVALAVCFARNALLPGRVSGPAAPDSATIAHEILHLFGASDKYGIPLHRFPSGSVTPRDIMRLEYDALGRMRIGPLTAREIGWGVSGFARVEGGGWRVEG